MVRAKGCELQHTVPDVHTTTVPKSSTDRVPCLVPWPWLHERDERQHTRQTKGQPRAGALHADGVKAERSSERR